MKKLLAALISLSLFTAPLAQAGAFLVRPYHHPVVCHNPQQKVVVRRIVDADKAPLIIAQRERNSILGGVLFIAACATIACIALANSAKSSSSHTVTTTYPKPTVSYNTSYVTPSYSYDYIPSVSVHSCSGSNYCDCVEETTIYVDERTDTSKPGVVI